MPFSVRIVSVKMSGPLSLDYWLDDQYGSLSSSGYGKEECCPLVVDFLCVIVLVAAIAGAAFLLNQVLSYSKNQKSIPYVEL